MGRDAAVHIFWLPSLRFELFSFPRMHIDRQVQTGAFSTNGFREVPSYVPLSLRAVEVDVFLGEQRSTIVRTLYSQYYQDFVSKKRAAKYYIGRSTPHRVVDVVPLSVPCPVRDWTGARRRRPSAANLYGFG